MRIEAMQHMGETLVNECCYRTSLYWHNVLAYVLSTSVYIFGFDSYRGLVKQQGSFTIRKKQLVTTSCNNQL